MRDAMWMTPTGEMMNGTMPTSPSCCPACALLHAPIAGQVCLSLTRVLAPAQRRYAPNPVLMQHLTALVSGAAPHASEALLGWLDDGISMMCAWA